MTLTLSYLNDLVTSVENEPPYEELKRMIDKVRLEVWQAFDQNYILRPDYVELLSRLWQARESCCEALLPEGQRERVRI